MIKKQDDDRISECQNVKMSECQNVRMSECQNVKIFCHENLWKNGWVIWSGMEMNNSNV
jgi:hypothetical protein